MTALDPILQEQIAYYRRRAGEYEQWFNREGRYDRGYESNQRWRAEIATVEQALRAMGDLGDVLELAAGTGIWTEKLAGQSDSMTAVDSSPEVLAINRSKVLAASAGDRVKYIVGDLFTWEPGRRYDTVFFGFWLSHVPNERFERFWSMVGRCLKPSGTVFFVDSLQAETSSASNHPPPDAEAGRALRLLDDGSQFEIVKVFHDIDDLTRRLSDRGWEARISATETYFMYGHAHQE